MFPLQDTVPARGVPLATWGLILVNSLIFLFELSLPDRQRENLFYLFGLVPARYSHPEWAYWVGLPWDDYWPFLTCTFLHGSWLHLVGNMWSLYLFGDNVEDRMGSGRFLAFYFLCGLAASLTHYLTNRNSTLPTIGASGAVAGVMGAYLLLFPAARIITLVLVFFWPLFVEVPAVFYLGLWYLSQLLNGVMALHAPVPYGDVAWWAHVGGFATGVVLLPLFKQSRKRYRRPYPDEYWPW
jgi:membrane associated rhomboid family serine protease